MPLDPELVPLREELASMPSMTTLSPQAARDRFRKLSLLSAELHPPPAVASVEDREVPGAAGPLRARVYRPREGGAATLVYLHGGGFVIGDVDSYDAQCRLLCDAVGATVLAFDYRLAPESPYPAAVEDALAVTRWALRSAAELGGAPARVAVGGDSAGGNLAAVACQELRAERPAVAAQLLLYPVTDISAERPSYREDAGGPFLTAEEMRWFERSYVPEGADRRDPRLSPLLARDLSGLPPALVVTAELDPLRDDGEAYAEALGGAGNRVFRRRYDGLVHGFVAMAPICGAAGRAADEICGRLRALLS